MSCCRTGRARYRGGAGRGARGAGGGADVQPMRLRFRCGVGRGAEVRVHPEECVQRRGVCATGRAGMSALEGVAGRSRLVAPDWWRRGARTPLWWFVIPFTIVAVTFDGWALQSHHLLTANWVVITEVGTLAEVGVGLLFWMWRPGICSGRFSSSGRCFGGRSATCTCPFHTRGSSSPTASCSAGCTPASTCGCCSSSLRVGSGARAYGRWSSSSGRPADDLDTSSRPVQQRAEDISVPRSRMVGARPLGEGQGGDRDRCGARDRRRLRPATVAGRTGVFAAGSCRCTPNGS